MNIKTRNVNNTFLEVIIEQDHTQIKFDVDTKKKAEQLIEVLELTISYLQSFIDKAKY